MIGDMRDEETLFSLANNLNTTTTAQFKDYYNTLWWPKASRSQIDQLATLYPQNPTAGSPYNTGLLNAITPQYKRISSLSRATVSNPSDANSCSAPQAKNGRT
jgi:acetylcholinesterase